MADETMVGVVLTEVCLVSAILADRLGTAGAVSSSKLWFGDRSSA